MSTVSKGDYDRFHEATGSTGKDPTLKSRTDRDAATLTPFERKQEFYSLLKIAASPGIVHHVIDFRSRYKLGLVKRAPDGNIVSGMDDEFLNTSENARATGSDMDVVNNVYRTMRKTIDVAGDAWKEEMLAEQNGDFLRMDELIEPELRVKYGEYPVSKRVASATAQTVSVGLGMQELAKRLYRKKFGVDPDAAHLLQSHRSGLRIAMVWADFNRHQLNSVERKIRTLRDDHEAIEPLHAEDAFDIAEDGTITFAGHDVLAAVADEKPNVAEGRFGCPGKQYIPQLWQWTEEVSAEHGLIRSAGDKDFSQKI